MVTGGGSGMGRELARQLAAQGDGCCRLAPRSCPWKAGQLAKASASFKPGGSQDEKTP
jgi:NAD(P)-dependent dehydrogenase (short-subunit alcohol dehydrogenase family)